MIYLYLNIYKFIKLNLVKNLFILYLNNNLNKIYKTVTILKLNTGISMS